MGTCIVAWLNEVYSKLSRAVTRSYNYKKTERQCYRLVGYTTTTPSHPNHPPLGGRKRHMCNSGCRLHLSSMVWKEQASPDQHGVYTLIAPRSKWKWKSVKDKCGLLAVLTHLFSVRSINVVVVQNLGVPDSVLVVKFALWGITRLTS